MRPDNVRPAAASVSDRRAFDSVWSPSGYSNATLSAVSVITPRGSSERVRSRLPASFAAPPLIVPVRPRTAARSLRDPNRAGQVRQDEARAVDARLAIGHDDLAGKLRATRPSRRWRGPRGPCRSWRRRSRTRRARGGRGCRSPSRRFAAESAATSTLPVTTSGLPSESHRSSSIRTRPFSSRNRVGTVCLNGTPARVSDTSSSTAVARACSIDSAPASAVTVNAIVPPTSRSASAPANGSSTLGVMPVTRADSAARAGSARQRGEPSRRPPVRRVLAIPLSQRARDQPQRHGAIGGDRRLLPRRAERPQDDARRIHARVDDEVGGRREIAIGDPGGADGEGAVGQGRGQRPADGQVERQGAVRGEADVRREVRPGESHQLGQRTPGRDAQGIAGGLGAQRSRDARVGAAADAQAHAR